MGCSLIDEQGFGWYENPISKHWGWWSLVFPFHKHCGQKALQKHDKEEVLTGFPYIFSFQRSMGGMDQGFPP